MAIMGNSSTNLPHVAFLSPDYYSVIAPDAATPSAGGAEVQLGFIAQGLLEAGFRVSVVTIVPGQTDEFELNGIRIVPIVRHGREIPIIRNIHPRLTCIWDALSRADGDVYWQRGAAAITAVVALYCGVNRRPFIFSGASDADFDIALSRRAFRRRGGWRDYRMYRWGIGHADAIVAQHARQIESCRRWYNREAVEIPSCYKVSTAELETARRTILWVSSVKTLKRPELVLELARDLPHLRFRIVGGRGPKDEEWVYEKTREEAAKLSNLEFVGFVPFSEVEKHFDEASLFLNTSDYEGFPNTFLQSWARGIPTLSFFDCGARSDGRPVGLLCRDVAEMKATISELCEDDMRRLEAGDRARRYFRANHTVEVAVNRYSKLIQTMLSARGRR